MLESKVIPRLFPVAAVCDVPNHIAVVHANKVKLVRVDGESKLVVHDRLRECHIIAHPQLSHAGVVRAHVQGRKLEDSQIVEARIGSVRNIAATTIIELLRGLTRRAFYGMEDVPGGLVRVTEEGTQHLEVVDKRRGVGIVVRSKDDLTQSQVSSRCDGIRRSRLELENQSIEPILFIVLRNCRKPRKRVRESRVDQGTHCC